MTEARRCASCGSELTAEASPQGLCARCLLEAGLKTSQETSDSQQETSSASATSTDPGPIDPEHLSPLFPQLEIQRLLGRGGMGAVYLTRHKALDRRVALKLLVPKPGLDAEFAERFGREARALARLNHPGIVAVYDFGQVEGLFYFLMEYVDGTSLREVMRQGQIPARQALALVPQICDALQYAHDEGVVHRDIKPENILIDRKGRIKIADFGLAKLLGAAAEDERLTGTHHVMGTRNYMAPEQLERPRQVDHRADIYSLGVVFYEMLTGELPLGRFAPPSQKVHVDVRLDEVVLRTLEKEPERRYQHASEVKTDVENLGFVETAQITEEGERKRKPKRLAGWLLSAIALATGVLAIWALTTGVFRRRALTTTPSPASAAVRPSPQPSTSIPSPIPSVAPSTSPPPSPRPTKPSVHTPSVSVDKMEVYGGQVTNPSGKTTEIPEDTSFAVSISVRWDPSLGEAGTHDVEWKFYAGQRLYAVQRGGFTQGGPPMELLGGGRVTLNENPAVILRGERGEDFKPGHYRLDALIDGKVVKKLEFDVTPRAQGTATSLAVDKLEVFLTVIRGGDSDLVALPVTKVPQGTYRYLFPTIWVRWDPNLGASSHDVEWKFYRGDELYAERKGGVAALGHLESPGVRLTGNPARVYRAEEADDLAIGHYRVDVLIDGKVVAKLAFDVVPTVPASAQSPTPSALATCEFASPDDLIGKWREAQGRFTVEIARRGDGYAEIAIADGDGVLPSPEITGEFRSAGRPCAFQGRHIWGGHRSAKTWWGRDNGVTLEQLSKKSIFIRYLDSVYTGGWFYVRVSAESHEPGAVKRLESELAQALAPSPEIVVFSKMVTTGSADGKSPDGIAKREVPQGAHVYAIIWVRWDSNLGSAGTHSVEWKLYRGERFYWTRKAPAMKFNEPPLQISYHWPTDNLEPGGHYRVDVLIDEKEVATLEFAVVPANDKQPTPTPSPRQRAASSGLRVFAHVARRGRDRPESGQRGLKPASRPTRGTPRA